MHPLILRVCGDPHSGSTRGRFRDSALSMIRPGFIALKDRRELEACVRRHREDHGVARRANALLLLDDGKSCAQIAKFLYGVPLAPQAPALATTLRAHEPIRPPVRRHRVTAGVVVRKPGVEVSDRARLCLFGLAGGHGPLHLCVVGVRSSLFETTYGPT